MRDAFAKKFSFSGYDEMIRYSEPVLIDGDSVWYVTEGPTGFLVWNESEIEKEDVKDFENREKAYLYLRDMLERMASRRTPLREVVLDDPRYVFRERHDVLTKLKQTLADELGFIPEVIRVEHGSNELWGRLWNEEVIPLRVPFFDQGLLWEYEFLEPDMGIGIRFALDSDFIFLLNEAKIAASRRVYFRGSYTIDAVSEEELDDNSVDGYDLEDVALTVGWVIPAEEDGKVLEGWVDSWRPLYHHPTYSGRYILGNGDLVDEDVEVRKVEK